MTFLSGFVTAGILALAAFVWLNVKKPSLLDAIEKFLRPPKDMP